MGYTNQKPECYGDPELYDPDDDECSGCGVNHSCSIRAQRKAKSTRPSYTSRNRQLSSTSTQENVSSTSLAQSRKLPRVEREPNHDITFSKILMHNTGLEVLQTVVDELSSSIRHIPRLDYGRYFERKKK